MKEDRERFLGAGFDGYLAKPIDIRAFPNQVRVFVERGPRRPAARSGEGAPG
jgi:two-component system, cell cycle response regulator DivK